MAKHTFKSKRSDFAVEMRTFTGKKTNVTYLVMKNKRAYHVFSEIEAKDAARDCNPSRQKGNVVKMWDEIWKALG